MERPFGTFMVRLVGVLVILGMLAYFLVPDVKNMVSTSWFAGYKVPDTDSVDIRN